jgi:hypothetical protein
MAHAAAQQARLRPWMRAQWLVLIGLGQPWISLNEV